MKERLTTLTIIERLGGKDALVSLAKEARADCLGTHLSQLVLKYQVNWDSQTELVEHLDSTKAEVSQLEERICKMSLDKAHDILTRMGASSDELFPPSTTVRRAIMRATLVAMLEVRKQAGERVSLDISDEQLDRIDEVERTLPLTDATSYSEPQWDSFITSLQDVWNECDCPETQDRAVDWTAAESYLPYQLAILTTFSVFNSVAQAIDAAESKSQDRAYRLARMIAETIDFPTAYTWPIASSLETTREEGVWYTVNPQDLPTATENIRLDPGHVGHRGWRAKLYWQNGDLVNCLKDINMLIDVAERPGTYDDDYELKRTSLVRAHLAKCLVFLSTGVLSNAKAHSKFALYYTTPTPGERPSHGDSLEELLHSEQVKMLSKPMEEL